MKQLRRELDRREVAHAIPKPAVTVASWALSPRGPGVGCRCGCRCRPQTAGPLTSGPDAICLHRLRPCCTACGTGGAGERGAATRPSLGDEKVRGSNPLSSTLHTRGLPRIHAGTVTSTSVAPFRPRPSPGRHRQQPRAEPPPWESHQYRVSTRRAGEERPSTSSGSAGDSVGKEVRRHRFYWGASSPNR
jgi:hypothetical protein